MTITIDTFIEQNVIANVSSLIADLAAMPGSDPGLYRLSEQAQEACTPVEDYESAAMEAGWRKQSDGWWRHGDDLANDNYGGGAYLEPDDLCIAEQIDPYEHEILEHWFVSDRLADHLERHGERIVRDFAGHCVWGRTTSGQAIKLDPVIETIFAETQSK